MSLAIAPNHPWLKDIVCLVGHIFEINLYVNEIEQFFESSLSIAYHAK
jgi:hypothetical protein